MMTNYKAEYYSPINKTWNVIFEHSLSRNVAAFAKNKSEVEQSINRVIYRNLEGKLIVHSVWINGHDCTHLFLCKDSANTM